MLIAIAVGAPSGQALLLRGNQGTVCAATVGAPCQCRRQCPDQRLTNLALGQ